MTSKERQRLGAPGHQSKETFRPGIGGTKFVISLPPETERTVALEQAS